MKRALVVGGANGIGLSIATELAKSNVCEKIYIVDKAVLAEEYYNEKFKEYKNRQTRFNQVLMLLKMYPLAFLKNDKHHQLLKTIIKNS